MTAEIFTVPIPIHAGGTAQLPVNVRLLVAAIGGLGAASLATIALDRIDGGDTALSVLVATATGTDCEDVTPRSRSLFVYALGMLLGLVFEGVVVTYETIGSPVVTFGGIVGLAEGTAAAVVALLTYSAVAYVVVPRYSSSRDNPPELGRRAWLALSVSFGLALGVMVPVAFVHLLPGGH